MATESPRPIGPAQPMAMDSGSQIVSSSAGTSSGRRSDARLRQELHVVGAAAEQARAFVDAEVVAVRPGSCRRAVGHRRAHGDPVALLHAPRGSACRGELVDPAHDLVAGDRRVGAAPRRVHDAVHVVDVAVAHTRGFDAQDRSVRRWIVGNRKLSQLPGTVTVHHDCSTRACHGASSSRLSDCSVWGHVSPAELPGRPGRVRLSRSRAELSAPNPRAAASSCCAWSVPSTGVTTRANLAPSHASCVGSSWSATAVAGGFGRLEHIVGEQVNGHLGRPITVLVYSDQLAQRRDGRLPRIRRAERGRARVVAGECDRSGVGNAELGLEVGSWGRRRSTARA